MEQIPSDSTEVGEDVSWRSCFFATLVPRTELSNRKEQVDVVAAYKVLGHVDDSLAKRDFTVVIS